MKQYRILTVNNKNTQKLFLSLPSKLYKKDCPQDIKTEKQILEGKHCLSKSFSVKPFVVVNDKNMPISRCLLTYYKDDPIAYVGFFESQNCPQAVKDMMVYVERQAKEDGKTSLMGPVNASIYIGYRFKVDKFEKIYTGEPYNKQYYCELWKQCGFEIKDKYYSNQLRKVTQEDIDQRLIKVYDRYLEKGYKFMSVTKDTFEYHLENVHKLMMQTYSSFNGFKELSKQDFMEMFGYLKHIINPDMVRMAYKDDMLQAFCVSLPNFKDLTNGNISIFKLIKMMNIKKKPSEYVIMYVGANPSVAGIGGALVHDIRNQLLKNQCTSIGALVKDGNVTGKMYEDLYIDKSEYVLYEKQI